MLQNVVYTNQPHQRVVLFILYIRLRIVYDLICIVSDIIPKAPQALCRTLADQGRKHTFPYTETWESLQTLSICIPVVAWNSFKYLLVALYGVFTSLARHLYNGTYYIPIFVGGHRGSVMFSGE